MARNGYKERDREKERKNRMNYGYNYYLNWYEAFLVRYCLYHIGVILLLSTEQIQYKIENSISKGVERRASWKCLFVCSILIDITNRIVSAALGVGELKAKQS